MLGRSTLVMMNGNLTVITILLRNQVMKTYIHTPRHYVYILSTIALVAGLMATPVRAQILTSSTMTGDEQGSLSMAKGASSPVVSSAMINLAEVDLDQLSKKEWRQLRREHIQALRTGTDDTWEQAAMNIIYLSVHYRDRVNFERASTSLLETYIHDRDTQHRMMALAAMHAIGDYDTMAHLSQRVRLEASPRVRHVTLAAVADYFNVDATVKSAQARQIGRAR